MCLLLMTFVPVQKLCVNIYICILYEFCYRTYIYIQQECHSVLVKLHAITFYRTVFLGSARFLGWMPLFVFFGLQIVSFSLINSLILGCSWLLVFVLNNTLILGIWCSAISHLPGCFCPWTFFQSIGFNMVPSDPFMLHLATQLAACNWLSLRRLVSWINHLPPACWSTFWKSTFKQQLGCRFDIMNSMFYFFLYFDKCNYICLDTSYNLCILDLTCDKVEVVCICIARQRFRWHFCKSSKSLSLSSERSRTLAYVVLFWTLTRLRLKQFPVLFKISQHLRLMCHKLCPTFWESQ